MNQKDKATAIVADILNTHTHASLLSYAVLGILDERNDTYEGENSVSMLDTMIDDDDALLDALFNNMDEHILQYLNNRYDKPTTKPDDPKELLQQALDMKVVPCSGSRTI